MAVNVINIGNDTYDLAPITFSSDAIQLLEIVEKINDKKNNLDAVEVLKAVRLTYNIILDCMVRGGTPEKEAKKVLADVNINIDSINNFMESMLKMD